jgi:hypothetical protein
MMAARIKEIAPISLVRIQFVIVRLPLSASWQDSRIFPEKKLLMGTEGAVPLPKKGPGEFN